MPDARTGHRTRTPGTGHRTPDTGRADTGHVDADGDADRATKSRWASGHPGTTTPLEWRTVLPWGAHAALGNMTARRCGHLPARDTAGCTARPLLGRSA